MSRSARQRASISAVLPEPTGLDFWLSRCISEICSIALR